MKAQTKVQKGVIRPARRATLSEDICEQLLKLVATGELTPGDKLPSERELMDMFSVGRSTVREALRSLALLGVVKTRQGYGAYISEGGVDSFSQPIAWKALVSVHTGLEVLEARKLVEGEMAALATSRATPEDLERLEHQSRQMYANLSDAQGFAELDLRFHMSIAEIADNGILLQFLASLRDLLYEYMMEDLRNPAMIELSAHQHQEIVEAIVAGNQDLARETMRRHVEDVVDRFRATTYNLRT